MKKTRSKKSRDTVPLNVRTFLSHLNSIKMFYFSMSKEQNLRQSNGISLCHLCYSTFEGSVMRPWNTEVRLIVTVCILFCVQWESA